MGRFGGAVDKGVPKFFRIDAQLLEHAVEGPGFEFVFRVTNIGELVPQIEGDMTPRHTNNGTI